MTLIPPDPKTVETSRTAQTGATSTVAMVIGGGPAGLMAAEQLARAGHDVVVIERMPSVGRKLLRAGVGGLNLTHAELFGAFVARYGSRQAHCQRWLTQWGPTDLIAWAKQLGIETFVGSSQRVFPVGMKAAPLLRAWLRTLQHDVPGPAVRVLTRHQWTGDLLRTVGDDGKEMWCVSLQQPEGKVTMTANVVVLALGGASWPQLGSDGAWVSWMRPIGVDTAPLAPANCGFDVHNQVTRDPRRQVRTTNASPIVGWSDYFTNKYAGAPLKTVVVHFTCVDGQEFCQLGELVLTRSGIEGSLVYAASALLRELIVHKGEARIYLDLKPAWTEQRVALALAQDKKGRSLSWILRSKLGLSAMHSAMLYELLTPEVLASSHALSRAIKKLPLVLTQARPLAEAISTAGGVRLEALTEDLMVKHLGGVFVAGEMLDWEAPTGGYLLTASLSSGWVAGRAAARWLEQNTIPCKAVS